MPDPHDTAMATVIARDAVRHTQARYADIVTRRAWPELADVMHPDCRVTVDLTDRALEFDGPAAIGDFIGGQLEQFDFFEFVILNSVIEIGTGAGVAAARMYIQEARQNVSDGRRSDTFGVYHDRFTPGADGRWRFARRFYRSLARTTPASSPRDLVTFDMATIDLATLLTDD